MKLENIFKPKHIGLNFSIRTHSKVLDRLGFVDASVNIDIRDNNAHAKYYNHLRKFINKEDVVFIVPSLIGYQNLLFIAIISGITGRMPYIVYFKTVDDPEMLNPLIYSLEEIRWRSEQSVILESDYMFA